MNNKNIEIFKILAICGACISFYIGAGFATMQEIAQYEVSYGRRFWVVILVTVIIYLYTNVSFATNGSRNQIKRGGEIYKVYFGIYGEKIGNIISVFFDYFSALFCYMSFVVMCGGANSTLTQQWNIPFGVGAICLTILVVITTIFGLEGILKALSKVGPIIIAMILIVAVVMTIKGFPHIAENMVLIDNGDFNSIIKQVGNGNPFASGASYGGFVILWFAAFLSEIGSKNKLSSVNKGMILSTIFIFGSATLCCLALIGNISIVANADIPALILAKQISGILAQIFAIVICIGIYSSAVPLLWTGVRKFVNEDSKKYKLVTIIAGILGCIIACCVPYKGLINVLYGINGYLGFVLIFFMIVYDIKTKMSKNRSIS